jgi:hypothetical protein
MFYRGKKRTKREPDAFHKTFAGFFEQIRGSGMLLVALLVSILVIMAVVWVASSRRASRESAAQVRLGAALDQPNPGERQAALRKVSEEFPGTRAEALALLAETALRHEAALKLADSQPGRREDELKDVLAQLAKFIERHPKDRLIPRLLERRALVLEDQGDAEKAAAAFDEAAKMVAGTDLAYLRGKLLYGRARCENELKQRDKAVLTLEEALRGEAEMRGDPWRPAASTLLAQLRPATKDLRAKGAAQDAPPPAPVPPATSAPAPPAPAPAPGKAGPEQTVPGKAAPEKAAPEKTGGGERP